MVSFRVTATLFCFVACWSSNVSAHHGDLLGHVEDETGGVLPGVLVELSISSTNEQHRTISDGNGDYSFSNVPHGRVVVTLHLINFSTFRREVVLLDDAEETTVDVVLRLALTADVVVTGQRTFRHRRFEQSP